MLEILTSRRSRKAEQPEQSGEQPPLEQLSVIREKIAALHGEQSRLAAEEQRALALAAQLEGAQQVADEAVRGLTEMHARRIAGEDVGDDELQAAEVHARQLTETASRGVHAARGATLAAERYRQQAGEVAQRVAALAAHRTALMGAVLAERAAVNRAKYEASLDAAEAARSEFLANEAAVRSMALELRLPSVTDQPMRNRDGFHEQQLEVATQQRAIEIAAELRGLIA